MRDDIPEVIQDKEGVEKSSAQDAHFVPSLYASQGNILGPVTKVPAPGDQGEPCQLGQEEGGGHTGGGQPVGGEGGCYTLN